jgi:hypothetical protein
LKKSEVYLATPFETIGVAVSVFDAKEGASLLLYLGHSRKKMKESRGIEKKAKETSRNNRACGTTKSLFATIGQTDGQ